VVINLKKRFSILNLKTYSGSIQHIVWTNHTELLVIADTIDTGLNLIKFKLTLDRSIQLTEQSRLKLDFAVLNVSYNRTANLLAIQSSDGLVFKYNENLSVIDEFQLPQACPTFQLLKNPTSGHEVYIGATQYYRLYVNGIEVANNVAPSTSTTSTCFSPIMPIPSSLSICPRSETRL
jgi:hypothetical protein